MRIVLLENTAAEDCIVPLKELFPPYKGGRDTGMRLLDNWIQSYLKMVSETEPPQRFHLWTAITIVGAVLGRKCIVKMGPETYFPNLYTVLIGPPGVRKGAAIGYGMQILREMQSTMTIASDAVTKEALCVELEDAAVTDTVDGRPFTHSSLFVVAPELIVFIKENDHERLGYLCDLYDGRDKFEYRTKHAGHNYIVNPGLWLLGGTTPNWVEIAMKQLGVGGGITSRTIFVFAAAKGKHISLTKMVPFDPVLKSKLITDLADIKSMSGTFEFTDEARKAYTDWYYSDRYKKMGVDDARFESYWQRLPSMVVKVSMIISAALRCDKVITDYEVLRSIKAFEMIHTEMPQAFGGLGHNPLGPQTEMVRNLLRVRRKAPRAEIMHTLRMHLNEYDYQRIRNSLLFEKFCSRTFEDGEEWLECLELPRQEDPVG